MALRMKLPTPRDLKEEEGWRFSSLRKMRQPAARERTADSWRGVLRQGRGVVCVPLVSGGGL